MGMKVNGTSGLTFPDTTTLASAGQASVRAWVNFNGTGTVAIRAAYNVTSITDNGTGNYTVNMTTAMPDVNYAVTTAGGGLSTVRALLTLGNATQNAARTTSSFVVYGYNESDLADADLPQANVAIFR